MKKITRALLPLLMLGFVLLSIGCQLDVADSSGTGEPPKHEEKIYWTGNIEEDFAGNRVSVIMDKYTGGINKKHELSFFGNFEKVSVTDLTILTEYGISVTDKEVFRQILTIELPGDSKENVVRAIRELEKIDGIKYAGPEYYCYLID